MLKTLWLTLAVSPLIVGCMTGAQHRETLGSDGEELLTVAAVQREIQLGMSGAQVLSALGSPNIVSTDENRNEIWVYDRVGTEFTYSHGNTGLISLIAGGASSVVGGAIPSHERRAGASRRTQKTLTIIVKFDDDKRVKDYSYHASRF